MTARRDTFEGYPVDFIPLLGYKTTKNSHSSAMENPKISISIPNPKDSSSEWISRVIIDSIYPILEDSKLTGVCLG